MATGVIFQGRRDELNQLVRGWDRRLRVQQAIMWLPRCLLPGLAIGLAFALLSRTRPWLLSGQILLITGIMLALGIVTMLLAVGLWPRPSLLAARRFDLLFGLQERVSTALELIEGRIRADDGLVALQVDDAWATAKDVRASDALPLVIQPREWGAVLILTAILAMLLVIPNPQEAAINQDAAQEATIVSAAEQLREITEAVASDTTLEPQDREELLQVLQSSTAVLDQPNVAPEEAFAALSDAQAALQGQSENLNQESAARQTSLQSVSEALQQLNPPQDETTPAPETSGEGTNPGDTLANSAEQLPAMSQVQQQILAESLAQAAEELQATNPSAAEGMRQASEALAQGNVGTAQQAMQDAASELQDAAQTAQEQAQSAEQLSQSAEAVQSSADQIGQQSQSNAQQGQPSEAQNGQQGESAEAQDGQPSDQTGQQGESGQPQDQQGQSGQSGEQGQQSSEAGQTGDSSQPGQQPGGQGQADNPGQGQGQAGQGTNLNEGSPSGAPSNTSGSGAGDAPGGAGSDQGGIQGGQVSQANNPDGQGEGQFDAIYAPQRVGGQTGEGQNIVLDPDASNAPVQQGEFAQNPAGSASVPYNQVFSDYSNAANQALESDYIPLGLRDVVRDYFSSLEPGQNNGNRNRSTP